MKSISVFLVGSSDISMSKRLSEYLMPTSPLFNKTSSLSRSYKLYSELFLNNLHAILELSFT